MESNLLGRRAFIGGALGAGAGLMAPGLVGCARAALPKLSFRFVHLTDIHVQPEINADKGMIAALKAVSALDPKPDFILLGGDSVMDVFGEGEERARMLFKLFKQTAKDHTDIPMHACIGNHDVFGWSLEHGVTAEHPAFGKKMVVEELGLPGRYHAFDHKGWRFYCLDTIQPTADNRYQGFIDEEQMKWLENDLSTKKAPETPAVVLTHIPIISVTLFRDQSFKDDQNAYVIGAGGNCKGAEGLNLLFAKHNVKLALSGHIHQLDRVEMRGVTFICDGAVSGNWWKGAFRGVEEGFGIVDVRPDGAFEHKYLDYGWKVDA